MTDIFFYRLIRVRYTALCSSAARIHLSFSLFLTAVGATLFPGAGNANVKTLQPRRGFDVFQETVNRDGLYIGCMKWLGISRGILTNHRSRNRRLCVDRIVQTRTAYAYRDRVFPNVLSEIYLLLEKKRIRFARICGKGKLLFGRNAEKACFPRIDGRSGRQVRRIENVNSNRSEPLGSSFLDGVPLYPSQCRSKSYTRSCCWW